MANLLDLLLSILKAKIFIKLIMYGMIIVFIFILFSLKSGVPMDKIFENMQNIVTISSSKISSFFGFIKK